LPALDVQKAIHLQNRAGDGRAHHVRQGRCSHEDGGNSRPVTRRKPEAQVEDDAGKEARLRKADSEAHGVEAIRSGDEGRCAGKRTPCQHHHGDGAPGSDAVEQQIGGQAEEEIADKKDAGAHAEHL